MSKRMVATVKRMEVFNEAHIGTEINGGLDLAWPVDDNNKIHTGIFAYIQWLQSIGYEVKVDMR